MLLEHLGNQKEKKNVLRRRKSGVTEELNCINDEETTGGHYFIGGLSKSIRDATLTIKDHRT